jgi:hypothetical protein
MGNTLKTVVGVTDTVFFAAVTVVYEIKAAFDKLSDELEELIQFRMA